MQHSNVSPACRVLGCALALILAVPQTSFAGTITGTAREDATKVFTFIADDSGQVLMTLTWTKASADLFMLAIDDGDDPLTWCIAAASQDRTQRCDFGAVGSVRYAIGVSAFRGSSKFQLNVQSSGSELVSAPALGGEIRELDPSDPLHGRVLERMRQVGAARHGAR